MNIVELAITLNKCEKIKTVLKSGQGFSSFEEFKVLMNLWLEKEQLKQAITKDQQDE